MTPAIEWVRTVMSELGNRVKDFALGRVGSRVGNGQCNDLVVEALRAAGARTAADYGENGRGNYVWGARVNLAQLEPGDIIQFRDWATVTRHLDGSGVTERRPHHSAIILANEGNGVLSLLEQNIRGVGSGEGGQVVQLNSVGISNHLTPDRARVTVSGQYWIFRPQPAPQRRTRRSGNSSSLEQPDHSNSTGSRGLRLWEVSPASMARTPGPTGIAA